MGLSRRNTIVVILFIALLMQSCKSKVVTVTTEKNKETTEILVKELPYDLATTKDVEIDKDGNLKPIELKLNHNGTEAKATMKDGVANLTLKNTDTVIVSKTVITNRNDLVSTDTKEFKDDKDNPTTLKGKWDKFKRKVVLWSLILNVVFIGAKILQLTRRVYLPM